MIREVPPEHRRRLVVPEANAGRSSVVVSLSFLLATALSGLLGILIGVVLGEGVETDAFLGAYSVYLVFLLFGANLRVALLPLLGAADDEARLRRRAQDLLDRIGATGFLVAALVLIIAPAAAWLLTSGAHEGGFGIAAGTLAILAPAAYCQLIGAAQSAVLAAGQRFSASAALFVASSATTVALATVLMLAIGALGAALGVLGGAIVLAVGHARYLARFGMASQPGLALLRERATYRVATGALAGAALPLAFQVNLTIALGVVSGAVGVVTAYTYGYFVPLLLTSLTGASIGFVSMPSLVADVRVRGRAAAEDYVRVFAPLGGFLYIPLAAGCAFLGRPVLEAVLVGPLSAETVKLLWDVLLIFLAMGLAWVLCTPVSTLELTLRRYRSLTAIALASVALQAAAVGVAATHGPRPAAVAHACVGALVAVALFVDVFRRSAPRVIAGVVARTLPAAALGLVFPAAAAVTPAGWTAHVAAAALGLALYFALALALWPDKRRRLLALRVRRYDATP